MPSCFPCSSLLAATALAVLTACHPAKAGESPNILVILVDDLGHNDLSYNGATEIETPNIDQLARDGVIFPNGYAPYPTCSPSRAGLMTGRYPSRYAMEANLAYAPADPLHGLRLEETVFAANLQSAGYRTGLVGKWHLGASKPHHPLHRGFEAFYGFLGGGHDYFKVDATGFATEEYLAPIAHDTHLTAFSGYLTDRLTDQAIAFATAPSNRPFYLHLAYNAPHNPLQAPEALIEKYAHVESGPLGRAGNPQIPPRRRYLAMVDALDQNIGRLVAALKAAGAWRNTLVFFLSDNGGDKRWADNGPFRGQKGSFHEAGVRVPFLASWPARWPQGATFEHPVIGLDIAATALALAGAESDPSRPLDGVNLDPFVRDAALGAPHEALFWRAVWAGKRPRARFAVRRGDLKLVKDDINATPALFDLRADPGERHDIAAQRPDAAEQLASLWNAWNAGNASEAVSWMGAYRQRMAFASERFHYTVREREQRLPTFQIGKAPLPAIAPPPPAPPVGVVATPGDGSVRLSWDEQQDPLITGYEYRWREQGSENCPDWHSQTSEHCWRKVPFWWQQSYVDVLRLANGVPYEMQLRARNSADWGAPAEASATPSPD